MQAKYRKNVVDTVLCSVFAPQKPALKVIILIIITIIIVVLIIIIISSVRD